MPNQFPQSNSINFTAAESERKQLAREGNINEQPDNAAEIVSEFVKEEERQQLAAEDEKLETELHETLRPTAVAQSAVPQIPAAAPWAVKSEFLLQLENVLADGLGDMYDQMEPNLKIKFKNKGEEIARRIEITLTRGRIKVKQIISWIKSWLRLIPGVNRFFLEQEAKIKADRILELTPRS